MAFKPINICIMVLNHTEKHLLYRIIDNFSQIVKMNEYTHNSNNNIFVNLGLLPVGTNKTGFNNIIYRFSLRGKLSIIQCDI